MSEKNRKRAHRGAHKNAHRRPKGAGTPAGGGVAAGTSRRGGKPPARSGGRQRWFYDVRQYALLTDAEGHLLILQLPAKYDEAAANAWTLPGGKLEPADVPGEGLLREIQEETGLPATLVGPLTVARWTTRNSKKLAIFYAAKAEGIKPAPKLSGEHQRAIWIKKDELEGFPFHRDDMRTVIQEFLK